MNHAMALSGGWLLALALGCTPRGAAEPSAAPAAETATDIDAPVDLNRANALIGAREAQWFEGEHRLLQPASMDDGLEILKLDQANLFGAGVAYAQTQTGVEAMALEAQIELAWGEAYMTLMEVMLILDDIEPVPELDQWGDAFELISIDHMTKGAAIASEVIEQHPDHYLGYRVAADYYRMIRDWPQFHAMIAKIEARNPHSNGLVFQRGVAAFQEHDDTTAAVKHLQAALAKDPRFVRAQAHLMAMQTDVSGLQREYRVLAELNPDHQIARWLGDKISAAPAAP